MKKEPENPYQSGFTQSPEDWFKEFQIKAKDIFKGAKEVTWHQYCPHLDRIVQLSTEPKRNQCELCVKEKLEK